MKILLFPVLSNIKNVILRQKVNDLRFRVYILIGEIGSNDSNK